MNVVDPQRPSTWKAFRPGLCEGCTAGCCRLPVEVDKQDLLRMELVSPREVAGSLKKVARRLQRQGIVRSFLASEGNFTLEQRQGGDCLFLDEKRRCSIYEKRPRACREFPRIGPRPGYCPAFPARGSSLSPRT